MDGFDLHSDGHLVTLFSATNYCGLCNNNGAVIEATWGDAHSSAGWTNDRTTLVLQAKLISAHVEQDARQTWVMGRQAAPPTPPRDRPTAKGAESSAPGGKLLELSARTLASLEPVFFHHPQ